MRRNREPADPGEAADPALAVALAELRWYREAGGRAGVLNKISDIGLLLFSAAATVAAALGAVAWVTSVLAAGSLVLAGLRRSFDWHENWVSFTSRWAELRSLVHQYQLLPEARRDEAARSQLMSNVDELVSSETSTWASRRRRISEQAPPTAH